MAGRLRKFSIVDIPRLKIGIPKQDNKRQDPLIPVDLDSPPPTPRSVRPPLSPVTEVELRTACAFILKNFRPSHIVYQEQHVQKEKPQLDYAAIKNSAPRHFELAAKEPIPQPNPQQEHICFEPSFGDDDAFDPQYEPSFEQPRYESRQRFNSVAPQKIGYKPDVAVDPIPRVPVGSRARADQLMMPSETSKTTASSRRESTAAHSRSVSNPTHGIALAVPKEVDERPRTAPRTESTDTTGSTPETDTTDYPWSEKASTAMTSAAATPARSSKRASSLAMPPGSESGSMPKFEYADADWMRQELDKHKKAQEERRRQGEAGSITAVSDTTPTQTNTQAPTPVRVQVPTRKPVPTTTPSRQGSVPPRADRAQSIAPVSSSEKQVTDAQREFSRQLAENVRSESRRPSRRPSRARAASISRGVKEYFRPGSRQDGSRSGDAPRAASRSSSATRQVKEFFRPSTAVSSRKPSVDLGRSNSRSRSIDSFRSTVSQAEAAVAAGANKFKSFQPFQRSKRSESSPDVSRPGSSASNADFRGRSTMRDEQVPPMPKPKPAINLNRDLPPLPSLNQWEWNDSPGKEKSDPLAPHATPAAKAADPIKPPRSQRHQSWKQEKSSHSQQPSLGERDEILAARMGSPTSPTAQRSHQPSVDFGGLPSQPATLPPAPFKDHRVSGSSQLSSVPSKDSAETSSANAAAFKHQRMRSQSVAVGNLPKPNNDMLNPGMVANVAAAGRPQLVTNSRANSFKNMLGRRPSHWAATAVNTPKGHSRESSDHLNFSRKYSMDANGAPDEVRYQNMVELTAAQHGKDKSKPKWWQKKERRDSTWMDQVLNSGSRSGMILTDEVAGAPIVRY